MLQTTFTAPKTLADELLALTDTHPAISLDVGEHIDPETYTFWLPEALQPAVQQLAPVALAFTVVDESIDYVAATKANFPPLVVGPYFVARNGEPVPAGKIGLAIAPNRAFGSGEHATTEGCLLAYEHLLEQGASFKNGLDFGAGSGILAIAAAKRRGTPVVAVDNDAPSVDICAENAALNAVSTLVPCELGDIPQGGPYDLVFANILLHPLLELAPELVGVLAKSGGAALILSGFTTDQAPLIAERYHALGLSHTWQHEHAGWVAQVWQRP